MPQSYAQRVYEQGSASIDVGQEAISTTAEEVVAARAERRSVIIQNLDESITVYWGHDNTVGPTTGGRLLAGESVRLNTTAAIWMEAASGTPSVSFTEEYD